MYRNFNLAELEQQYSPSSCIDDINVFIKRYIDESNDALTTAQSQNLVKTELQYGDKSSQTLDLFLPIHPETAKKKLHVYIHGGYWQELSKNESCFAATNFQQHGYHFAVLNYTLAPNASVSDIVAECRQALAWLYQNSERFGYQKDEVYLSGSSAGGHLVMMMAMTNWAKSFDIEENFIKGICAVSGVYDLTPIAQTYINEPLQLTPKEIIDCSPLLQGGDFTQLEACKVIMAYGDNETTEFKRQTAEMTAALRHQHLEVLEQEIAQRNHFDVILDLALPESWLFQQVRQQMGG